MSDRHAAPRRRRWLIRIALAGGLMLAAAGISLHLPIVPFRPVCLDHNAEAWDRFRAIEGELAPEFVGAMLAQTYASHEYRIRALGGTLYQTPAMWLPYYDLSREFIDINRYRWWPVWLIAWDAADAVFVRRLADGSITEAIHHEYVFVDRWRDDQPPRPLNPAECGLMEELAVVGGRFAEPARP